MDIYAQETLHPTPTIEKRVLLLHIACEVLGVEEPNNRSCNREVSASSASNLCINFQSARIHLTSVLEYFLLLQSNSNSVRILYAKLLEEKSRKQTENSTPQIQEKKKIRERYKGSLKVEGIAALPPQPVYNFPLLNMLLQQYGHIIWRYISIPIPQFSKEGGMI